MPIVVDGKTLETDEEGYLANINDWVPGVAGVMAKEDDLELTDEHWDIINFLREYYEEYQIAPAVRVLTKAVGKKLGKDKLQHLGAQVTGYALAPPTQPSLFAAARIATGLDSHLADLRDLPRLREALQAASPEIV
ncbi:MAG: dissimilatory sulfite reductase related protein, partial [Chloroflexota bacterium]|nr:dissimilatory sulfite reductase related protein [Chloroflexota bacterium]